MHRVSFAVVCLLLVSLQAGPFIGLLGFMAFQDGSWTLSGLARDVCLLTLLLLALLAPGLVRRAAALPASAWWALALVLAFSLQTLWSPSATNVAVLNLRRIVYLPLLFLAMLLLPWTAGQVDRMFRLLVASSLAVATLGLVERALPDTFWTEWLQIDAYTAASTVDRFGWIGFYEGGRFFNWDFEPLLGQPVRRMVSTYIEPTTLAAAMAAALALVLARHARGHRAGWAIGVLGLAGVLALSKAHALYLLMLLGWRLMGWPGPGHVLSLSAVAVLSGWVVHQAGLTESTFEHVTGLIEAVQHLGTGHWLGAGLGAAGNYTDQSNDLGFESGLGNVIAQSGVLAVLPMVWAWALARDLGRTAALRRDPGGAWLASWLLFWVLSFLFSASSLGVGGNALGFLALALYLHPASAPLPMARAAQPAPQPQPGSPVKPSCA